MDYNLYDPYHQHEFEYIKNIIYQNFTILDYLSIQMP